MDESAPLSLTLTKGERDRLERLAKSRGASVQDIVLRAVSRLIHEEPARLDPADLLERLRSCEGALREAGVSALWVFGSWARGDADPASDVDLLIEFDPAVRITLSGVARLRADLAESLGAPVDLVERRNLRPGLREVVAREAIAVF